MIHYISGGERSGKSGYASQLALQLSDHPIYLATSRVLDDDFSHRVKRHQSERDSRWTNIEEERIISSVQIENQTVVLDCITLWLANIYFDLQEDVEASLVEAKKELTQLFERDTAQSHLIIISNEIGMGVHAQSHLSRKFVELQGWVNQFIAKSSHQATFMVSGLPLTLKEHS